MTTILRGTLVCLVFLICADFTASMFSEISGLTGGPAWFLFGAIYADLVRGWFK